jgi:hypothetical protein
MKNFKKDSSGNTTAFFFKDKIPIINKKLLSNFVSYSKIKKDNIRICLHSAKKDKLHSMLVLLHKRNNSDNPHKHLKKTEVYQILLGKIKIILFLKKSKKYIILDKNKPIIKIPNNIFHLVQSISNISIFHETRVGPFEIGDTKFFKD